MTLELVIWDYNGTLTDDLTRFAGAVNTFLQEHGVVPATEEEIGCYDGDILAFYRRRSIDLPGAEIGKRVFQIYAQSSEPLYLKPRAVETLEMISLPQVLVSKHPAPLLEREIDLLGIRKYFTQILGGVQDKAALFQQLCTERKMPAAHAVSIGDMWGDIVAGKRAGTKTIAVPGYHPRHILEQHSPDFIVEYLPEVCECFQNF